MTRYDLAALFGAAFFVLLYHALEIAFLRRRVGKLEANEEKLRKTLDDNGIYSE